MPQVDLAPETSHKMPIIAAVAAAGLVMMIIGAVLVMVQLQAPKEDPNAVLKNVQDKTFAGKDDEAISYLRDEIGKTKSKDNKLSYDMQLGSILESKGDYTAAVEAYKRADAIKSGFGTTYAIARASEAGGNKTQALESYKKALAMLKKGDSKPNNDYLPIIEAAITRVEAK
jgi:tetratricopeptide (TPR) repeat protein